jgi:biotin-dependent carboxylase-like uncharacterized protein
MSGVLEIRSAGPLTTVQDLGRPGLAHLGVPRSGALDEPALRLANRLVGNDATAAGLEITMSGCVMRATHATTVAITGASGRISVNGREHRYAEPVPVRAGAVIEIGAPIVGVRTYLAVAGGIAVASVLGSRSTDTLSGLGPAPLHDGDVLPIGYAPTDAPAPVDFVPPRISPGSVHLRIRFGPRDDWFAPEAKAVLTQGYTLSVDANRIGARLAGGALPRVEPGRQLPSEGIVAGAVQVTADGLPLVFLADHPTTGGYPVIAVVDAADLWRLAQARPGDTVIFHGSQR